MNTTKALDMLSNLQSALFELYDLSPAAKAILSASTAASIALYLNGRPTLDYLLTLVLDSLDPLIDKLTPTPPINRTMFPPTTRDLKFYTMVHSDPICIPAQSCIGVHISLLHRYATYKITEPPITDLSYWAWIAQYNVATVVAPEIPRGGRVLVAVIPVGEGKAEQCVLLGFEESVLSGEKELVRAYERYKKNERDLRLSYEEFCRLY